jgi:YHS domain-containing protein
MHSRRTLFLGALAFTVAACSKAEPSAATASTDASGPLAPSETIDPAFTGCARSCGSKSAKDRSEARAQPGAVLGDAVYCPVSGAVFRINESTPRVDAHGKTLYFCCAMCAAFFSQHEAEVLAKRGLI